MTGLHEDREGIEPEALDEDVGDPAAAFDALRRTIETQGAHIGAEMTLMRRGLEAAFDELEKIGPPQDYKPELARLVQAFDNVAERLHGVEQSPLLRKGPEYYTAVLERGGEGLIRSAAQQLERQAADLERAGRNLAACTRSAYDRKAQDFRMWRAGVAGVLAGMFLILLLPRFLPFSADSHVASLVMGQDRVSAGYAMIEAAAPSEIEKLRWGGRFYDSSGADFSACLETAKKTGKDQRCSITVPAPAQ